MDINDKRLTKLCAEINVIRRRSIINIDKDSLEEIKFIDPYNYTDNLVVKTNNLVLGKRGSGKTTLFLSSIKEQKDTLVVAKDCQVYRNFDKSKVLIISLLSVLSAIIDELNKKEKAECLIKNYNNNYSGIKGLWKGVTFRKDKKSKEKYSDFSRIFSAVNYFQKLLENLKELPDKKEYSIKEKSNIKSSESTKNTFYFDTKANIKLQMPQYCDSISGMVELTSKLAIDKKKEIESNNEEIIESEYVKTFDKFAILEDLNEKLCFLFNDCVEYLNKGIVAYFDDFYYTELSFQPYVIQYLLDISKSVKKNGFCFKIGGIPNRVKLNGDSQVDFSYKDDIPPIKLDRELSDLSNLKAYLLSIISSIASDFDIESQEIVNLFNNDSVITHAIIATGGIPRDFLMAFTELISFARADNSNNIKKEHVYAFVSDLKEDKANNIEVDTDISPDEIRDKISILRNEVVDKLKTNVILYPSDKAKEDEKLLKNLVNLRYLHLISENVSTDRAKKKSFTAYLIDMTFYTGNKRLRQNFDFRRFWERDDSSRLNELRSSKIWYFGAEEQ